MSYDVSLEADLGGGEAVSLGLLNENYTWNVYPIFRKALGEDGFSNKWDGLPASVAAERCEQTIAAFDADPASYYALNPANGWGDFDGARRFIETIRAACRKAPNAVLRVG